MEKLSTAYNPKDVEEKIYRFWEKSGFFRPKIDSQKKPYVITIPPPNITGSLHMGHALNNTIQDILIRRRRMQGTPTLWVTGTDHAGIATQNVVEKELKKQGLTRDDLGREKFIKKIWQWKEKYGHIIIDQLKKLGCSCDWSRERFTMDEGYSEAVKAAFTHYYNKGYIYQGERVVNWCPRCQTSLSDLEVEYKEQKSKLYYFRYDKKFPIAIATTRPETKFGDSAVAVNPTDKRYKKYIGKIYDINFAGVKRKIKIIGDKSVDPKFGTGALGVTPAHSLIDEELAHKYKLPGIKVIDEFGHMTKETGPKYQRLKTKEAAEKLIGYLKQKGLLEKEEDTINNLSICYRCDSPLEPQPSKQWFLKMDKLAKPAIEVVKKGKIKFYPARWKKVYIDWLENIKDWCISRQIWWGHRLPVWQPEMKNKKSKIKNIYVGDNPPKGYKQIEDVLDTWFSSALWPFAVLGWTEENQRDQRKNKKISAISDLEYFYPTTTLSTARDILYLWVARMIFSGLEFTGKIPFEKVYIHPTVLNKEGKRMSKSLGTGVDPLELMDKYGTDATRFGLAYQDTGIQDMKFSEEAILAGKKFANKIWNASRFTIMSLSGTRMNADYDADLRGVTKADKIILAKLDRLVQSVDKDLDNFRFGQAAHNLYDFFWHDFCDVYIEASKPQLKTEDLRLNTQKILSYVLVVSLKLLHPFMPFVTEEIYQKLPIKNKEKSIMVAKWPQ